MHGTLLDLRHALRSIRKRPGASLVIVLTLGLGLGVNATFFTSFHAMVTRPLPFDEPDRLVRVSQARPELGHTYGQLPPADYLDVRDLKTLDDVEALAYADLVLDRDGIAERVAATRVSAGLFPLLGVAPARGRLLQAADDRPGAPPVAVVSHHLWQSSFGGDPAILERDLRIDGVIHEVVGVMGEGFRFPLLHDLWVPLRLDPAEARTDRGGCCLEIFARLAPGADVEAALAEARALGDRIARQNPETHEGRTLHVRSLHDTWMPPVTQTAAWVMQGLVSLVLLIVCVNVASMVLAQATTRRREAALRTALGAGRWRLLRQTLIESLLLALCGGALGLLLTAWQGDWVQDISKIPIPYWLSFEIDGVVVAYAVLATVLVGLFLGLLPALRDPARNLARDLREGGRGDSGSGGGRLRRGLVAVQYAGAVVILAGALLMVRSYQEVRERDPGFRIDEMITARVDLPDAWNGDALSRNLERLLDQVGTAPGVDSAAVVSHLPLDRSGTRTVRVRKEGSDRDADEGFPATLHAVSAEYFATLDIPLRRGRLFRHREIDDGRAVALVDQALAETLWPEEDPLGRRLRSGREEDEWLTVIGTVGTVDPGELLKDLGENPRSQVYVPFLQEPVDRPFLVARSSLETTALGETLRRRVAEVDASMPLYSLRTMHQVVDELYFAQHIWGVMFSIIAFFALLIAAVGAYGVTAYSVVRRRRELGIRLALGAGPGELQRRVVRQGLMLAVAGLAAGTLAAIPLGLGLQRLLHGVSPADPTTFAIVAGMLLAIATVANLAPARRAARVDPAIILREE